MLEIIIQIVGKSLFALALIRFRFTQ